MVELMSSCDLQVCSAWKLKSAVLVREVSYKLHFKALYLQLTTADREDSAPFSSTTGQFSLHVSHSNSVMYLGRGGEVIDRK